MDDLHNSLWNMARMLRRLVHSEQMVTGLGIFKLLLYLVSRQEGGTEAFERWAEGSEANGSFQGYSEERERHLRSILSIQEEGSPDTPMPSPAPPYRAVRRHSSSTSVIPRPQSMMIPMEEAAEAQKRPSPASSSSGISSSSYYSTSPSSMMSLGSGMSTPQASPMAPQKSAMQSQKSPALGQKPMRPPSSPSLPQRGISSSYTTTTMTTMHHTSTTSSFATQVSPQTSQDSLGGLRRSGSFALASPSTTGAPASAPVALGEAVLGIKLSEELATLLRTNPELFQSVAAMQHMSGMQEMAKLALSDPTLANRLLKNAWSWSHITKAREAGLNYKQIAWLSEEKNRDLLEKWNKTGGIDQRTLLWLEQEKNQKVVNTWLQVQSTL